MSPSCPFPPFSEARFIKNRYRKVVFAITAYHHRDGPVLPEEWAKELHEHGYVHDSFELMDIPVNVSMRRKEIRGRAFYYGMLSVRNWTVIWDGDGKVGFDGDREQFERDAVLFAMLLDA